MDGGRVDGWVEMGEEAWIEVVDMDGWMDGRRGGKKYGEGGGTRRMDGDGGHGWMELDGGGQGRMDGDGGHGWMEERWMEVDEGRGAKMDGDGGHGWMEEGWMEMG